MDKIEKLEKTLDNWKRRNLTLFGKVTIIKSLPISKIIYSASILNFDEEIIKKVNTLVFKFLWDGKDKIRRTIITNTLKNGGLNMINIKAQMNALKAAWIPRIYDEKHSFNKIPHYYLKMIAPDINIILKMTSFDIEPIQKLTYIL